MSIWGPGPFENDDGADWFADLQDEPTLKTIRAALEEIADPQHIGFVEVIDGAAAVGAAEVLAELLGSPGDDPVFDDEVEEMEEELKADLAKADKRELKKLIKQAIDALEVVLTDSENSELRQMWEEQDDGMPEWIEAMTSLQERLGTLAI